MAVSYTQKQTTWTQNYVAAVQTLMSIADTLGLLDAQFTNNAYGTGGAEAITDAVVQTVVPAATAANLNSTEAPSSRSWRRSPVIADIWNC